MIKGIGVDIVEVAQIEETITRWGENFLQRVFTPTEQEKASPGIWPQRLAARFAAKEAVMKALGVGWGPVGWKEIEVVNDERGKPVVRLFGNARKIADSMGITEIHLSLAHTGTLAVAQAVAVSQPLQQNP